MISKLTQFLKSFTSDNTPKMFYRLQNLTRYFITSDINDSRISVIENSSDGDCCTIQFKFYSKLGSVEIILHKVFIMGDKSYSIEYITYAGTRLFNLTVNNKHVYVEPCMGYDYNVSAKDIDLAIFELEQYLQDNYGDIDVLWDSYLIGEKLAKESHDAQIKFLEQK